jgi:predicted Zn-dependent peptidase
MEIIKFNEFLNEQKMTDSNIINLKSPTDLSGFYIIYKGSTLNEKPGWRGISHLMEHLMCKNYEHLYDDFDREGISWNAYTSENEIVFYITGLEKYVDKWRKPFLESLMEFKITDEVLQSEKRIVLEEYDQSFNQQVWSHLLNLNRKLFNLYGPIGARKDIEEFTLEDCKQFFDLQFAKPSMIINVSKNFIFDLPKSMNLMVNPIVNKEIQYLKDNPFTFEQLNEFKKSSSVFALTPIIAEDLGAIDFVTDMLGNGLQSPLYQEIREKRGLTYGVYSYIQKLSDNSIIANIGCQTDNSKVDEVKDTLKLVIENPEKYLTQKRFDIIKESMTIQEEKSKINRYASVRQFLLPKSLRPVEYLKNITLDKVLESFNKYFKFDNMYISTDKNEF